MEKERLQILESHVFLSFHPHCVCVGGHGRAPELGTHWVPTLPLNKQLA